IDTTVDPRSVAMGGAGVAAANGMNAMFQNPAAMSGLSKESFTLEAPLQVRLLDEGDLKTNLDTVNTSANNLSNAMSLFSASQSAADAAAAATALSNFSNALLLVDGKNLMGTLYGGLMMAVPSKNTAFGLKLDARTAFGGAFNYSTADQTTINTLATDLGQCALGTVASCSAAAGQVDANGQITTLTSDFNVRGVVIGEVGLSMAHHYEEAGGFDIGITPKYMKLTTFDIVSSAQSGNASATSTDGNQQNESAFNLDLGASKTYTMGNGNHVKTGVVMKNVISKSFKTFYGNPIELSPQLTAGVAYGSEWFTGTADVDVKKNKAMIPGITHESQFVRLGAELDAWGWAQLRFGYRHDLAGNYEGLPSLGMGLNLKLVNIDFAVAAASKKEAVASLQIGTHF
ncbi:MAG: conjugal transfer protein TraF, partial [Sideroxydans sp.]|nr:conjugal transfer protein TraF [Sideroxydans sp.]